MKLRYLFLLKLIIIFMIFNNGCSKLKTFVKLQTMPQNSYISGFVNSNPVSEGPVGVLLISEDNETKIKQLVDHQLIYQSSSFKFSQPLGIYYLLAFEDKNEDLTIQDDERVGWYGPIYVMGEGKEITGFKIELSSIDKVPSDIRKWYASGVSKISYENKSNNLHVGEVARLDDHRFSKRVGDMGMWDPVKFYDKYGAGIYFLEPYKNEKIPILFVHGVGGSPKDFQFLINGLDKNRFQPWIVHFPSGSGLDQFSRFLSSSLLELQIGYGLKEIHIVAHSIGGLAARDAINQLTLGGKKFVRTFVSISSPWKGHPAADVGADRSRFVLPLLWRDLAQGSRFLKDLHKTSLPAETQYYLFFGYKGWNPLVPVEGGDGTLSLASMIDIDMQDAASKVYGFNESHESILSSPEVMTRLNRLLVDSIKATNLENRSATQNRH